MNTGKGIRNRHLPNGMMILHEDRDLIVIHKPAGLLTIATDRDREKTAYVSLTDYVRKGQVKSRNRVFIVHRIDRDTSGVLVFAKTPEAKELLQGSWEETTKYYRAVVHGVPEKREGIVKSFLMENSIGRMYSTPNSKMGKWSETRYRVLSENGKMSLMEVELLTGRKHQIRVHLADLGHPIAGDDKYGKKDGVRKMALHAFSVKLRHPWNGKWMTFESPMPEWFGQMMVP